MSLPAGHDIVVIGASAGGVRALSQLVAGLPEDLPAALFVALHMAPGYASQLSELLSARGPLRAALAVHGEPIVAGRIYVAPPDNHLTVHPGFVQVTRGPKENGHRPAVDPLFRSAARAYGPRVVGVVLTGYSDCGTAGLMSIKARGGAAVVQDPADAIAADMPRSAMAHVAVDEVVPLAGVATSIIQLVTQPAPPPPAHLPPGLAALESDEPGAPSDLVCPDCNGRLTETELNGFHRFACHVGHAYSVEAVTATQAEQVERALWSAVRALEEAASLAGRLARSGTSQMRERFTEKEESHRQQAEVIRAALLAGKTLTSRDGPPAANRKALPPPGRARGPSNGTGQKSRRSKSVIPP